MIDCSGLSPEYLPKTEAANLKPKPSRVLAFCDLIDLNSQLHVVDCCTSIKPRKRQFSGPQELNCEFADRGSSGHWISQRYKYPREVRPDPFRDHLERDPQCLAETPVVGVVDARDEADLLSRGGETRRHRQCPRAL